MAESRASRFPIGGPGAGISRFPVGGVGTPVVSVPGLVTPPTDPALSAPDLIVQLIFKKEVIGGTVDVPPCLPEPLRGPIAGALKDAFVKDFPNVSVTSTCVGGPNPATGFGVWLNGLAPTDTSAAQALLANANIGRGPQETIAFSINRTLFEAVKAKHFPPNPSGSIQLHPPAELEFHGPDTIVTRIHGVDTDPVPDVDFTLTITEKFTGGPGSGPQWYATTSSLDKDTTGVWVTAILSSLTPLAFLGWYQAGEVAGAGPPSVGGFGSGVASAVLPISIPIAGGKKIPIVYDTAKQHNGGIEVDDNGMYVGGFLEFAVPRQPSVSLSGRSSIRLPMIGNPVTDTISVTQIEDMRGNLFFEWAVNGQSSPSHDASITLSFDPETGPFGVQYVDLTVTDEDGLKASARFAIDVEQPARQQGGGHNQGGGNSDRPPLQPF